MKLIIQIPCFNEAETLPAVLRSLPEEIDGIDKIEVQVVDDGSTDGTVEVARLWGADYIVTVAPTNRKWLGRAFKTGIDHALARGADIIVNTDGDNQYPSQLIPDLVAPIIAGRADVVIGDRKPAQYREFSAGKRLLQRVGNSAVRLLIGADARDATSGFRAYSRTALLQLNRLSQYTYTVDTLIQAHEKGLEVAWLEITPNPKTRDSRLVGSLVEKVGKSGGTILRLCAACRPFPMFALLGLCLAIPAAVLLLGFVSEASRTSFLAAAAGIALFLAALIALMFGVLADQLAINRSLVEEALSRVRKIELKQQESTGICKAEAHAGAKHDNVRLIKM